MYTPRTGTGPLPEQVPVLRAAVLVTLGAIFQAILAPYLTFGLVAPNFAMISVVVAASVLRELQGVLLGFFGGILLDALGGGLFGAGALSGLVAGLVAVRSEVPGRGDGGRRMLVVATVLAVAAYDVIGLAALNLAGGTGPPVGRFVLTGLVPDVLLNALLAYLSGRSLLRLLRTGGAR
ncbi:MAG: rod shape-determining protein MreD [Rubrobacter sp.]|nr:rod shape-determining protein MreD [Rubrobacter sp.]